MAHYLITGGAGFIGSHLCERLAALGHSVHVLDDLSTGKRENLDASVGFTQGCITEKDIFAPLLEGVDGVFHLAAIASVERSRQEWAHTHAVNLGGMVNLLEAIAVTSRKIPVVYASSAAIYGDNPALPLAEDAMPRPQTAYGADKLGCELHAKVASGVHGIPTLGLRFFNVYGPRQDPASPYSGVISIFARNIPAGRPIVVFGDGRQTRDFIYVGDVVRALCAGMEALKAGKVSDAVCNVCTRRETSLMELIAAIENVGGHKAEIGYAPPRAGDIQASLGDASLLATLLGIDADTPLEAGLKAILEEGK